jgi:hypothetical protein
MFFVLQKPLSVRSDIHRTIVFVFLAPELQAKKAMQSPRLDNNAQHCALRNIS